MVPIGNAFLNINLTKGPAIINCKGKAIIKFKGRLNSHTVKVLFDNPTATIAPYSDIITTIPKTIEQEIITITGKSGSGKSTLLNIIGLLDGYTSGSLFINGKQITNITSKEATLLRRYNIGYIFQNYALIEKETVEENLKLAIKYSYEKDKEGIIQQALGKVGLENYEKKKIYELSGGEQQRIAIARVFIKPCRLNKEYKGIRIWMIKLPKLFNLHKIVAMVILYVGYKIKHLKQKELNRV